MHQKDPQHDHTDYILNKQAWFSIQKSIHVIYHRNGFKYRNDVIFVDAEKAFNKIQQPFVIKAQEIQELEGL